MWISIQELHHCSLYRCRFIDNVGRGEGVVSVGSATQQQSQNPQTKQLVFHSPLPKNSYVKQRRWKNAQASMLLPRPSLLVIRSPLHSHGNRCLNPPIWILSHTTEFLWQIHAQHPCVCDGNCFYLV